MNPIDATTLANQARPSSTAKFLRGLLLAGVSIAGFAGMVFLARTVPLCMPILEWGGCGMGLIGAILNARGRRVSFLYYGVSNVALAAFTLISHHWGLFVMQAVYGAISVLGWCSWKDNAPVK